MTSYSSYSSGSSRRSHRSSYQHPQSSPWSLPTNVQGPPSHLYAAYFPAYHHNPDIKHRSRHYSYSSSSSSRSSVYPPPISIPPTPHTLRPRRQSTGDGPRVSPQHIYPPPHAQPPPHARAHSYTPAHSYHPHTTKSILKNRSPPPQTPYVIVPPRTGRSRAYSIMSLLGKRNPGLPVPPTMPPSRRVRFDLPPESNEPWRRR